MRLGDLDALRKNMEFVCMGIMAGTESYNAPLTEIDNAPTVDLKDIYQEGHYDGHLEGYTKAINEERPQGEWKFIQGATTQGSLKCPFCDYRDYHKTNSNFCPNCGAKMKGKNSSGEAYD